MMPVAPFQLSPPDSIVETVRLRPVLCKLPASFESARSCAVRVPIRPGLLVRGERRYPRGVELQAVHRVPTLVGLSVTHRMPVGCADDPALVAGPRRTATLDASRAVSVLVTRATRCRP